MASKENGGEAPNDRRFQLLIDSITDYGIYMLDPKGHVLTWNRGAAWNKGYEQSEVIGKHFSMFFTQEDAAKGAPEEELLLAVENGHATGEAWRVRKNGERFWASFVLTAMRDETGELVGFAKVVRDLTQRKHEKDELLQMAAQLREERNRFHAAAESSMDGIFICEALRGEDGRIVDFVILYVNNNVRKIVALSQEELIGGRFCELIPNSRSNGIFDQYCHVVLTGEPLVRSFPAGDSRARASWLRVQAVKLNDGIVITASDITDLKRNEERALHLAQHDPLTGLLNQRLLRQKIEEEIERALVAGTKIGIFLIDLNGFKEINDTYGHQVGDAVLVAAARRIQSSVRSHDTVVRMGGDEFLIIMPDLKSADDIDRCTEHIYKALDSPFRVASLTMECRCSLGVSLYPDDALDTDALIRKADAAMYLDKRKRKQTSSGPQLQEAVAGRDKSSND